MPASLTPASAEELARLLKNSASQAQTITVAGHNSKRLMAGPILPSDIVVSTAALQRVLHYERDDLTISVEAGMPFSKLQELLLKNGQMIALDPPFWNQATVGGMVASNSSGPMRRAFGTARDLVIGMTFATLEGKLVKTGGMVVKNVAGLDMAKLMIGSFGTLAAITDVNFRVHALAQETRTFYFTFPDIQAAIEERNEILKSILQPIAIDLITPAAAARVGFRGFGLLVRAGGSRAVLERYARELPKAEQLAGGAEASLWQSIREFTPDFLRRQPGGVVLRVSTPLADIGALLKLASGPAISRAGSGVTYLYFSAWQRFTALERTAKEKQWHVAVEFAPGEVRGVNELWIEPESEARQNAFAMMKKIKAMFDPQTLLNRSRLYGRI